MMKIMDFVAPVSPENGLPGQECCLSWPENIQFHQVPWSDLVMVHIYGSESHILEGEIVATYHFGGLWSHKYGSKECGSKKSECFKTSNRNIQKLLKIRDNLLPTIQARKSPKTHAAAKKCCGWEKPAMVCIAQIWCPYSSVYVQGILRCLFDLSLLEHFILTCWM